MASEALNDLLKQASRAVPLGTIPPEAIYTREAAVGSLLKIGSDGIPSFAPLGTLPVHVLATTAALGSEHSVSELTSGQVLRASGATTAAFVTLNFTDLAGKIADAQVNDTVTYTNLQAINTLHVKSPSGGEAMLIDGGSGRYISFGDSGLAGPSFDAYSAGVKIVLRDNISASRAGVAMGVDNNENLWLGTDWVGNGIKFYAGTTLLLTMQQNHVFVPSKFTAASTLVAPNVLASALVQIGTGAIPPGAKPSLHWADRLTNDGDIGGEISINVVGFIRDVVIFKKDVTEFTYNPVSMVDLTLSGSFHVATSLTVGGSTNDAIDSVQIHDDYRTVRRLSDINLGWSIGNTESQSSSALWPTLRASWARITSEQADISDTIFYMPVAFTLVSGAPTDVGWFRWSVHDDPALGLVNLEIKANAVTVIGSFGFSGTFNVDLEQIQDVVAYDSLADDEVLQYNTAAGGWRHRTLAEAGVSAVGHTHALNNITNPTGNKTFVMTTRQLGFLWTNPGGNPFELEVSGAYSGAVLHIHQHTGNPGLGTYLIQIESTDVDVHQFISIGPAATTEVFCTDVSGDAYHRSITRSDGMLLWGPGNATQDTNFYRDSAGILKSDGGLTLGGVLDMGTNNITNVGTYSGGAITITGNIIGASEDTFLSLDAGANRIGFVKKSGFVGKLAYGSTVQLAISRSSTAAIVPGSTYTDVLTFSSTGAADFQGNAVSMGALTATTGVFSGAINAFGVGIQFSDTNATLFQNTNDGSDNKRFQFTGGGAIGNTRAASIQLHGNEFSTSGGQLALRAGNVPTGHILFETGGSERVRIANSGNVLIGTTTAATGNPRLDVVSGSLDILTLVLSQVSTDVTNKVGVIAVRHRTNSEEPLGLIMGLTTGTINKVSIGGGDPFGANKINAATSIEFLTAANITTVTGTLAADITGVGVTSVFRLRGDLTIDKDLNHDGDLAGFFATPPITKPTGVAVTSIGIHAALVDLGLIAA